MGCEHPPVHTGSGRTAPAFQRCCYLLRIHNYCPVWSSLASPTYVSGSCLSVLIGVALNRWRIVPPHREILLAISCIFVTYVVAGVRAQPDWGETLRVTIIHGLTPLNRHTFLCWLQILVLTISPYMIFLVASNICRKQQYQQYSRTACRHVAEQSGQISPGSYADHRCCHCFPRGISGPTSALPTLLAHEPLAGQYASTLFALGVVGASFARSMRSTRTQR